MDFYMPVDDEELQVSLLLLFNTSALKNPTLCGFRFNGWNSDVWATICWKAELFQYEMLLYTAEVISGLVMWHWNCWIQPWVKMASSITGTLCSATWRVKRREEQQGQCFYINFSAGEKLGFLSVFENEGSKTLSLLTPVQKGWKTCSFFNLFMVGSLRGNLSHRNTL